MKIANTIGVESLRQLVLDFILRDECDRVEKKSNKERDQAAKKRKNTKTKIRCKKRKKQSK